MTNKKFCTQDLRSQTILNAIVKPLHHMLFLLLIPQTNYILTLIKPFSFVWYVIPLLKTGALALTCDLFVQVDKKNGVGMFDWYLSEQVLTRWWHPVASSEALDLLYWVIYGVLYQRTAAAIKMASLFGTFFCQRFVCYCPGGCWGNTEWVVARWRCPVASGVAMDMPHWAMPSVLLRRTDVAIKTAGGQGAFVHHHRLVCIIIHSYKTMLWSIKTKDELTICLLLCLELVRIL